MAEILYSVGQGRAATIATCPYSQGLAVAPKADGGSLPRARESVHLYKASDGLFFGDGIVCRRFLEAVASIRVADGDLHRLVWSWNNGSSDGLLAGGFDGGVVSIWNPAAAGSTVSGKFHFDLPQFNKPTDAKAKENASKMARQVELIYMDQLDEEVGGWQIVEENCSSEADWELVTMKPAALLENQSSGRRDEFQGSTVLKITDLDGPVRGLAFNNQYPNMLAAAGKADKLNIYHIDYPVRDSTSKYEFTDGSQKAKNAQVMFLEWHPYYPAILASTSDAGITTIWDIRNKKPVLRYEDRNGYCTEVHWSPKDPLHLAVSSIGQSSDTVKVWDSGKTEINYLKLPVPVSEFGPQRGVTSLSWSAAHNLILTTDIGGGTDCWTVDGKKRVELSGEVSGCLEARWCEAELEFVVSTTDDVKLCKLLSPPLTM